MFKALVRTMPSLTGNITLCCSVNDLKRVNSDEYVCYIQNAYMNPLQPSLFTHNIQVDLLNGIYPNDIGRFYHDYKDYFYQENFTWARNDYAIYNKYKQVYKRNLYYELGCTRWGINNKDFMFFAPIYIDNVNSLPEYFIIKIKLGDTITKKIKIHISSNSDKNILGYYLRKYLNSIDNKAIQMSNTSNYVLYNGIDVVNGALNVYKNAINGNIYSEYMSMFKLDSELNNGYEQMKMIMRQIIPISFSFNIDDVLTSTEKKYFLYSPIHISGYWQSHGVSFSFFDFSYDYDITQFSLNDNDDVYGESIRKLYQSDYASTTENNLYNFHEKQNINYRLTNKITKNFNRWKLSSSDDKNPYIVNMSFLYSNNQNIINYYNFPIVSTASGIIYNNALIMPYSHKYMAMYNNNDWGKLYLNNISNWFIAINSSLSAYNYKNNDDYWSNVVNDTTLYRSILYKNLKNVDKFGVFAKCNINVIDNNDAQKCRILYDLNEGSQIKYNCGIFNINEFMNYDLNRLTGYTYLYNIFGNLDNMYDSSVWITDKTYADFRNSRKSLLGVNVNSNMLLNKTQKNCYVSNDVLIKMDNKNGDIIPINSHYNTWYKMNKYAVDEPKLANNMDCSLYTKDITTKNTTFEKINDEYVIKFIVDALYYSEYGKTKQIQYITNIYSDVDNDSSDLEKYMGIKICTEPTKQSNNQSNIIQNDVIKWIKKNIYVSHKSTMSRISIEELNVNSLYNHYSEYDFFVYSVFILKSKCENTYQYINPRNNKNIPITSDKKYNYIFKDKNYNNVPVEYQYVSAITNNDRNSDEFFERISHKDKLYFIFYNPQLFDTCINSIVKIGLYKINNINEFNLISRIKASIDLYCMQNYNKFSITSENKSNGIDTLNKLDGNGNFVNYYSDIFKYYTIKPSSITINTYYNDIEKEYCAIHQSDVSSIIVNSDNIDLYVTLPLVEMNDTTIGLFNNFIKTIQSKIDYDIPHNEIDNSTKFEYPWFNMYLMKTSDIQLITFDKFFSLHNNELDINSEINYNKNTFYTNVHESIQLNANIVELIDIYNLYDTDISLIYQNYCLQMYANKNEDTSRNISSNMYDCDHMLRISDSDTIKEIKKSYIKIFVDFVLNTRINYDNVFENTDTLIITNNDSKFLYGHTFTNAQSQHLFDNKATLSIIQNSFNNDKQLTYFTDCNIIEEQINTYNKINRNVFLESNNLSSLIDIVSDETNENANKSTVINIVNMIYDNMQNSDESYADSLFDSINIIIDLYNKINEDTVTYRNMSNENKKLSEQELYNKYSNDHSNLSNFYKLYYEPIHHINFYSKYNTNTIDFDEETFTYNNERYLAYIMTINVDSSTNSFNIKRSNNPAYTFNMLNQYDLLDKENANTYIEKHFKYIAPFLKINILNSFIQKYKENVQIPRKVTLFPNKVTKEMSVNIDNLRYFYMDSMQYNKYKTLYSTVNDNVYMYNVTINRYFDNTIPVFKKITHNIEEMYALKFKSSSSQFINEDNIYLDTVSLSDTSDIVCYDSESSISHMDEIEIKSFNNNLYYYIPQYIVIDLNKILTYKELLEYEKEEVVISYFINYINKNAKIFIEDNDIKLFLYNIYKVSFISEVHSFNAVTNEKLYTLKYQFILHGNS